MTNSIANVLSLHARQLQNESPWIWLYEFQVPGENDGDPPRRIRLTNALREIPFGQDSAGVAIKYLPLPIAHSEIAETTSGDLPQLTIQVANPKGEIANFLVRYKGLEGAPVAIRLVQESALDDWGAQYPVEATVIDAAMDERVATVRIGGGPLHLLKIPPERYSRTHCPPQRVPYGGPLCGYDLTNPTLAAAHPTCTRLVEGEGGCRAHGDAEVAAGLARKHPERFGGKRSIPRERRA